MSVQSIKAPEPSGRSGFPVWHCPAGCGRANDMLRGTCRACGAYRPCEHFDGERHCGVVPTHMFISGPRCDAHVPGASRASRTTSLERMEKAA